MTGSLLSTVLLTAGLLQAQLGPGNWSTDVSRKSIDLSELLSGGPPKDGIPALVNPKFVAVDEAAAWLAPNEPVMVVEHAGEVRIYPLQILIWHELANDEIGGLPILVSYCPLCNAAVTFDRRVDGEVHEFGVSGMLRNSDMVMFDRATDSLWQQATGEALVGEMTGQRLAVVSSQLAAFGTVREAFPAAQILSRDTGYSRPYGSVGGNYAGYESRGRIMFPVNLKRRLTVPPMERLVSITDDGKSKAYPFGYVRERGVTEGKVGNQRYVIFFDPEMASPMDASRMSQSKAVGAVGVFSPEIDGKRLSFRFNDGVISDKQTNSRWNLFGMATEGELAGQRLVALPHGVYYAFAWLAFRPDTQLVGVLPPGFTEPSGGADPTAFPGSRPDRQP